MYKMRQDKKKIFILGEPGQNEFEDELIRDLKGPTKDIKTFFLISSNFSAILIF